MDHTDNINLQNDDLMNVETNIEGIDNRMTDVEANIVLLETEIDGLDTRISSIEQILSGKKYQYFSSENKLITARIRRMGEGTVFSLSVHIRGGSQVQVQVGGVPGPGQGGGVPSLRSRGVPGLRSGGGPRSRSR